MRALSAVLLFLLVAVNPAQAAPTHPAQWSVALEGDGIAYGLGGYSGIIRVAAPNRFEVALGSGRYHLPEFVAKTQDNFDEAQWDVTSESIQVLRVGYRFAPPLANGFAVHAIAMHQRFRISSEPLAGVSRFKQLGLGISGGYYLHLGAGVYVYPVVSVTYDRVYNGTNAVQGRRYRVPSLGVSESVHVGWERGF